MNFEKLAALFEKDPRTAAQQAGPAAEDRVKSMVAQKPTRRDLAERLAGMVAAYNASGIDAGRLFASLRH